MGIALAPFTLTSLLDSVEYRRLAEVAELADALRSGRSDHPVVWVQIPPSAFSRRRPKLSRLTESPDEMSLRYLNERDNAATQRTPNHIPTGADYGRIGSRHLVSLQF